MADIKALTGSLAPRPKRASYARSIYDAIESIKGPATMEQIQSVLPATDDADKWTQFRDTKLIEQRLASTAYNGYIVQQPSTGRWTLAPRAYYEKAQQHLKNLNADSAQRRVFRGDRAPKRHRYDSDVAPQGYSSYQMMMAVAVGFISGVGIAMLAMTGIMAIGAT